MSNKEKHFRKVATIQYGDDFERAMNRLKASYGTKDISKTIRYAINNCPTKEEFEKQEALVNHLEENVKKLYERHIRLEDCILKMGNYIKRLEREHGKKEGEYIKRMVTEEPSIFDFAIAELQSTDN